MVSGRQLTVNNHHVGQAMHCSFHAGRVQGYFFESVNHYKKRQKNQYAQWFIDFEKLIKPMHAIAHQCSQDIEDMLAVKNSESIAVRVLLYKALLSDNTAWTFTSSKGFLVHNVRNTIRKKSVFQKKVIIRVRGGSVFCNGKKIQGTLCIEPLCGYAMCNNVEYDGSFNIVVDELSCMCVNEVDLEDYIVAVLRTESWPGWPLEVNKAFAITCRSYVSAKILETYKNKPLFHVKNTNEHQTYRGRHNVAVLKNAVNQTKGIVLGFDNKPILAMFDSCCGSVIPANISDFDFKKVPYLARPYACFYCKHCSLYSWNVSYDSIIFEQLIRYSNHNTGRFCDIRVSKKDEAGVVQEVHVKGLNGVSTLFSGKQLYSLLKEVKSFYFDIHKSPGTVTLSGKGYGHHLGLCQWGARRMVAEGWGYRSILEFYYPKTYFMKLTK